jgi:hypothetical protein
LSRPKKDEPNSRISHESIHFRLCHYCFHLNESDTEVLKCEGCRHFLIGEMYTPSPTPTNRFYRRESQDQVAAKTASAGASAAERRRAYITGLSVDW